MISAAIKAAACAIYLGAVIRYGNTILEFTEPY